ncbi:hypothetical protein KKB55_11985, partial [Myxococcota bacterium]|nr:hypothetical protein [Myxococcota bacterium]
MPIILFKEKTARAFFARHLALALLGALGCQPEEQAARDAAWVADTAWVADARWAGDLGQLEDGAPRVDGGLRLSYEGRYTSEAGDHVTLLLSSTAPTPLDVALYLDRPLDARLEPPHARLTPATPTARVLMIGQDNSALDGDRQITIDARGGGYTARALINHRDDEVALRPRAGRDPHAGRWVEQLSEGRGVWILAPDDTQDGAPWLIAHEAGVGYACWRLASGARVPLTGPAAVEGRREGEALIYREGEALYRVDTRSLARTRLGVAERLWAAGPGVTLISHDGALAWLDEAGVAPLEAPRAEGLRGCVAGRGRVACWGEAGVYEGALGDALTGPRLSAEAAGEPALRAAGAWWGLAHGEIVDLEGQAVMTATPQRHLSPLGGAALLGSGPGALDPTAA